MHVIVKVTIRYPEKLIDEEHEQIKWIDFNISLLKKYTKTQVQFTFQEKLAVNFICIFEFLKTTF